LLELEPNAWGRIGWIEGDAPHRLELVEKGVLPRVRVEMEARHQGQVRVKIKGVAVTLSETQARAIWVQPISREEGLASLST
jgi:Fe2+ transport system protein FeoA